MPSGPGMTENGVAVLKQNLTQASEAFRRHVLSMPDSGSRCASSSCSTTGFCLQYLVLATALNYFELTCVLPILWQTLRMLPTPASRSCLAQQFSQRHPSFWLYREER